MVGFKAVRRRRMKGERERPPVVDWAVVFERTDAFTGDIPRPRLRWTAMERMGFEMRKRAPRRSKRCTA